MAFSAIISTSEVFGVAGGTTTGINTTGANLIIIALTYQQLAGINISDSKGNIWLQLTTYEGVGAQSGVVFYYCYNPIVGSGHTFSTTSHFSGINVLAVSGAAISPFERQNGTFNISSTTSQQPGPITPSSTDELVVTAITNYNGLSAPLIPSGYTSVGTYATLVAEAGGMAYIIQTVPATENPTWTGLATSTNTACNIAVFRATSSINTLTGASFLINFM